MRDIVNINDIVAMLPIYEKDMGNCTQIITNDKVYIENSSISTCIKNLADYYNISLYHNRINYGNEIGITNKVPLVINEDMVYIYVNVRKPILKHDAAYGIVNIKAIEKILIHDDKVNILMKSGMIINTRESSKTIKKRMLDGRVAKDIYKEKHKK